LVVQGEGVLPHSLYKEGTQKKKKTVKKACKGHGGRAGGGFGKPIGKGSNFWAILTINSTEFGKRMNSKGTIAVPALSTKRRRLRGSTLVTIED